MRIVHSYSSRPMFCTKRYGLGVEQISGNIWLNALSVAYAKRCGAEIVLHTDTMGRQLLGHLPYDAVYLTLDDMPKRIHPRFWASGKFFAMQAEPTDSVHIDGDVFLKRRELIDEIEAHDFVAQNREEALFMPHYQFEMTTFRKLRRVAPQAFAELDWFDFDHLSAANAGVIRYNDTEFKERYIGAYLTLTEAVSMHLAEDLERNEVLTPDIVAEQLTFVQLANRLGKEPHYLLRHTCVSADAEAKGYQHLMSQTKYQTIGKVAETLEIVNKDIYAKTRRLCPSI